MRSYDTETACAATNPKPSSKAESPPCRNATTSQTTWASIAICNHSRNKQSISRSPRSISRRRDLLLKLSADHKTTKHPQNTDPYQATPSRRRPTSTTISAHMLDLQMCRPVSLGLLTRILHLSISNSTPSCAQAFYPERLGRGACDLEMFLVFATFTLRLTARGCEDGLSADILPRWLPDKDSLTFFISLLLFHIRWRHDLNGNTRRLTHG